MTFPLEKILTVSAKDWIKHSYDAHKQGVDVGTVYEMVGVHVEFFDLQQTTNPTPLAYEFAKKVPSDAEVVVDYRTSCALSKDVLYRSASGTALIPRLHKLSTDSKS